MAASMAGKRHHNAGDVEHRRDLALPVAPDRLQQNESRPCERMIDALQNPVGDRCHQEHDAIERGRAPARSGSRPSTPVTNGIEREPEQQMQVGPEDAAVDACVGVQHVMVVVPVDAEVDEAQHVAEEHAAERTQGAERRRRAAPSARAP